MAGNTLIWLLPELCLGSGTSSPAAAVLVEGSVPIPRSAWPVPSVRAALSGPARLHSWFAMDAVSVVFQ